jgi:hypothetical protein
MNINTQSTKAKIALFFALILLAATIGSILALWINQSQDIFFALVQSGLAWCF